MGTWGTSLFSDDMALDIRAEYNALLSFGKSTEEIEEMLIDYYSDIFNDNNPDEDVFWFVLALCEWKKGRLTTQTKIRAMYALDCGRDLERWNTPENMKNYKKRKQVLTDLKNTIMSPMPTAKVMRKPTVHHCPWKVGSLLAYRIVSNKEFLKNHPCNNKYVLLRVIRIDKHPISILCPTEYYNETMLVGLYGWIGDSIPNPKIVNNLEYIPIRDFTPQEPHGNLDLSPLNILPKGKSEEVMSSIKSLFDRRIETCAQLSWLSTKDQVGDITYLDCDESFNEHIPDFFNTSICAYSITGFYSFDITLSKRFEHTL